MPIESVNKTSGKDSKLLAVRKLCRINSGSSFNSSALQPAGSTRPAITILMDVPRKHRFQLYYQNSLEDECRAARLVPTTPPQQPEAVIQATPAPA